ncbi:Pentatricopeptide repeat-containing protein [Nymphaea thermarum]|nr:Pentatricopeptide repeat-containing protein [Nymphaea thermarum]
MAPPSNSILSPQGEVVTSMNPAHQIHAHIVKNGGTQCNTLPLTKLLSFTPLSSCGDIRCTNSIFTSMNSPSTYLCNAIIRGYAGSTTPEKSILLFCALRELGVETDHFTYTFLLKACSSLRATAEGKQIHGLVCKAGLVCDCYVQNSLIHMYCRGSELSAARQVFAKMPERDVVSWTSMMSGYAANDRSLDALLLLKQMEADGLEPNEATVLAVLRACADLGALSLGRKLHDFIQRKGFDSNARVFTALIDMYAKCGRIDLASEVFDGSPRVDVFSWTAMISGLAIHGLCESALECFARMQSLEIQPDEMTLTAVLAACRNAGWVSEGMKLFKSMEASYGVIPTIQHYGCIVDLLARAGQLEEAEKLIEAMPMEADAVLWRTLVWGCRLHGDITRGERLVTQKLLAHETDDSGNYVLLCNLYASAKKWQEKARVRKLMKARKIEKPPGTSMIEVNGTIHEFLAGDSEHPDAGKIYAKWDDIAERLRLEGHHPKVSEVMLDIEDEGKVLSLHHHSEKLAIAFGLIKTNPDERILIVKNLRSCEDCHSSMKLISKIYRREIIVRDRIRFHYFKNGSCSCKDFW